MNHIWDRKALTSIKTSHKKRSMKGNFCQSQNFLVPLGLRGYCQKKKQNQKTKKKNNHHHKTKKDMELEGH